MLCIGMVYSLNVFAGFQFARSSSHYSHWVFGLLLEVAFCQWLIRQFWCSDWCNCIIRYYWVKLVMSMSRWMRNSRKSFHVVWECGIIINTFIQGRQQSIWKPQHTLELLFPNGCHMLLTIQFAQSSQMICYMQTIMLAWSYWFINILVLQLIVNEQLLLLSKSSFISTLWAPVNVMLLRKTLETVCFIVQKELSLKQIINVTLRMTWSKVKSDHCDKMRPKFMYSSQLPGKRSLLSQWKQTEEVNSYRIIIFEKRNYYYLCLFKKCL